MTSRENTERNIESAMSSINTIKEFISSNVGDTEPLLERCDSLKDSLRNQKYRESILIVHKLSDALRYLQSRKSLQVIVGAMKILPVLTALREDPKLYGPLTENITRIATCLMSIIWKKEGVREDMFTNNLLLFPQVELERAKTIQKMKTCNDYLTTMEMRNDVGEYDTMTAISTVGIHLGSFLLLKLQDIIKLKIETHDLEEAETVLSLIEEYALYAFLRSTFLLRMYAMLILTFGASGGTFSKMLRTAKLPPTIDAIQRLMEENDRSARSVLEIFINPPYRAAYLLVHFDASSYPLIGEFAQNNGWEIQNLRQALNNKCFQMFPQNMPCIRTIMSSNMMGTLRGTFDPDDHTSTLFRFKTLNYKNDNYFHILSEKYSWYVMMGRKWSSARGTKTVPGEKGEWKVIKFEDGNYMMCTKQCLGKFIYMSDTGLREVKGEYVAHGESGHWVLTPEKF